MKITVLTVTFRDSVRILGQAKMLEAQTFQDFEWVVVDDLYGERSGFFESHGVGKAFPFLHVPPRHVAGHQAPHEALNTAIMHARGDLLYFMADTVAPTEGVLEAHWEAFEKFGPAVIMSGPMAAGKGHVNIQTRLSGNSLDGDTTQIDDEDSLRQWYWAGRNDSASLEYVLRINGFRERMDGFYGGGDVVFAAQMIAAGCRYLGLRKGTCYDEFPHEPKKPTVPHELDSKPWQELFKASLAGDTWSPNDINLREERDARMSTHARGG